MEMEQQNPRNDVMSVGDWVITLIITALPLIGIIMLFVWAFSSNTPQSKANWAKAALILVAAMIVLYIIIFAVFGAAFMSMAG
jgi:membrane protein YdbS with pleckstrin-like domain